MKEQQVLRYSCEQREYLSMLRRAREIAQDMQRAVEAIGEELQRRNKHA